MLYAHSYKLLQPYVSTSVLNVFRLDGVTIFFVLSGFLIGQILIRTYEKVPDFNFKVLSNFWIRRWLRTLPVYFLVLLMFYVVHTLAKNVEEFNLLAYATFTQNLISEHPKFFGIAWSLSVEEWFYLVTPILLFVFAILSKHQKINLILIIGIMMLFSLLMRFLELQNHEVIKVKDIQPIIRKVVIFRLDCIMFGVIMAYIKIYYHKFWKKSIYGFLVFGIVAIAFLKIYPLLKYQPYLHFITGGNLLAIATMCFLPYLDNYKTKQLKLRHKAFIHVSLISYSLYLTHTLVYISVNQLPFVSPPFLKFILLWLGSILVATVLYFGFEKPILVWRDKIMPDKYKKL